MSSVFAYTWYDETAIKCTVPNRMVEQGQNQQYDVAIVGGGLAGLSCAYELARGGCHVAICEAHTIGSGASGRNGGFCTEGWATGDDNIRKLVNPDTATVLDRLGRKGLQWMSDKAKSPSYRNVCQPTEGVLSLWLSGHRPAGDTIIDKNGLKTFLSGPRYKWGEVDKDAFHFHPLNFMRLFANECAAQGVEIYQNTGHVRPTKKGIRTKAGTTIKANRIIWATGGYFNNSMPWIKRRLLPVQTFICVTSPMEDILNTHIPTKMAVGDNRRAGNYFRRLPDGRLLWGMGVSAFEQNSTDKIAKIAMNDIAAHFPKMASDMLLSNIQIDYAWAGNMAYARHFMPYIGPINKREIVLCGFGGHGMNTAPISGQCVAKYILGEHDILDPFLEIPKQMVYGSIGKLAAEFEYRRLSLFDHLAECFDN